MAHIKDIDEIDTAASVKISGYVLVKFGSCPFEDVLLRLENFLQAQKLMVPNKRPQPDAVTDPDGHAKWSEWRYPAPYRVVAIIRTLCNRSDLNLVKDLKTVKQTLAALKLRYDGDKAAEFYTLHKKWESLAKEPTEDIHTYFARAVLLRDRLGELQQPVTEQALVAKLMSTLPKAYHLYVELFKDRYYTPESIKYHDFLVSMQQAEVAIGEQSNTRAAEKALRVSDDQSHGHRGRGGRHSNRGRGAERVKRVADRAQAAHDQQSKRGRGSRNERGRGRHRTRQQSVKFEGHCHHCGRYGHMVKDCYYAPKQQHPQNQHRQQFANNPNLPPHMNQQQRRQDGQNRAQYAPSEDYASHNAPQAQAHQGDFAPQRGTAFQQAPARAYMASEEVAHYSGVVDLNFISSVLDSGSTRHMTPIKAALYEYEEFSDPPVIYVGNGVPCKVLGKGNLYVRPSQYPAGNRDIKITDVWYVPDLIETLISLKQLAGKGARGEFGEDTITVYDKTLTHHLFTAKYKAGVGYVPEWEIIAPQEQTLAFFARQTKEDALLWHARLGHCNMPAIAEMVKNNHVTGINVPHTQFCTIQRRCVSSVHSCKAAAEAIPTTAIRS